jgi:protein-S-isoprenylcysteine O-methyltransferase Ste14
MMFLKTLPFAFITGAPLFLASSDLRWPLAWAYVAVLWLGAGTVFSLLARYSPELLAERMKPPSDRDKKSRRIAVPLLLVHWSVAGLDARFGWSHVPLALSVAGLLFVAAGLALTGWTLLSNPYASSAVRIQTERSHQVISSGPYALVRHPMYLGVVLVALGSGPALGSWWCATLLVPLLAVFVARTLKEDRMLHDELEGYRDYAARVRWRVVPGLF